MECDAGKGVCHWWLDHQCELACFAVRRQTHFRGKSTDVLTAETLFEFSAFVNERFHSRVRTGGQATSGTQPEVLTLSKEVEKWLGSGIVSVTLGKECATGGSTTSANSPVCGTSADSFSRNIDGRIDSGVLFEFSAFVNERFHSRVRTGGQATSGTQPAALHPLKRGGRGCLVAPPKPTSPTSLPCSSIPFPSFDIPHGQQYSYSSIGTPHRKGCYAALHS